MRVAKIFLVQKDFLQQNKNPFCSASRNAFPCPSPIVQIPGTHPSTLYTWVYVGPLGIDFWLDGYVLKWQEIGDIAAEINGGEEDEEEDKDEEDAAKVPPTHTVALETLTIFSSIPEVKELFHISMNLKRHFLKIHEDKNNPRL
ncbi:hypothetical protein AVEN_51627-1 [Araneus ventricosus]|uniref:Uncharacterized protein n=1 Tax=Araneus ventricosus TaxID=182803 RepID=A0A4Y2P863_ARAVE|nr:hypothetical protein AVEN_51627-1 [Araneus ventricosus]